MTCALALEPAACRVKTDYSTCVWQVLGPLLVLSFAIVGAILWHFCDDVEKLKHRGKDLAEVVHTVDHLGHHVTPHALEEATHISQIGHAAVRTTARRISKLSASSDLGHHEASRCAETSAA